MARAKEKHSGGRNGWVWLSLLPLGLGAWAPMVAGDRCGVRRWIALGLLWPTVSLAGWIWSAADSHSHEAPLAGWLVLIGWIAGIVTSLVIRPEYQARISRMPPAEHRWPQPTARSLEWSVRYALVAFIVTFGGDVLLGLLLRDVFGVHVGVGVAVLSTDATLLAALVPLARKRGLSLRDLGLRSTLPMRSLGLALLTLVSYGLFAGLYTFAFIGHSAQQSAGVLSQVNRLGTVGTIVVVIAVSLSAPIVEEIFFRGLLFRSLRNRLPLVSASLAAGCLFGLVHIIGYPLVTLPVKAFFGVLACLLYERTGSLLPGIAVHSFVDASAIDVALTGNDDIVFCVFGALIIVLVLRWAVVTAVRPVTRASPAG